MGSLTIDLNRPVVCLLIEPQFNYDFLHSKRYRICGHAVKHQCQLTNRIEQRDARGSPGMPSLMDGLTR